MKNYLITVVAFVAPAIIWAQSADQFKSLQLNSSPAYVVLGVDPDNIQRPNSPTDFIASAQSAIVNGRLQPNFAMETTPYYWRRKKPENTTRTYNPLYFIASHNYWDNLARSITLSFATSPSDSVTFGSIPVGTGLGLGFHMQLVQGQVSQKTRKTLVALFVQTRTQLALESLRATLDSKDIDNLDEKLDDYFVTVDDADMTDTYQGLIRQYIKQKLRKKSLKQSQATVVGKIIDELKIESQKSANDLTENKIPLTREGFMVELAFADGIVAEESRWDNFTNVKAAIWLTPSYRFNVANDAKVTDYIDIIGVTRLTFNSRNVDSSSYFDAGAKLQWTHNNLSVASEGIYRFMTAKPETLNKAYTWRADMTLSYKINDAVTFKATFGRNFDGNSLHFSDPDKIFAIGGFNFGFTNFLKKTAQ